MSKLKKNAPGAVTSLVCGILAIVLCWFPVVGLTLGIVALVSASRARYRAMESPEQYGSGGVRVAGFVCGIVGTVFAGIYSVYWMILLTFFGAAIPLFTGFLPFVME